MDCFVCGARMEPFLKKEFHMERLGTCEYVKCSSCGMVVSKTHYEMGKGEWQALNHECHAMYQGSDSNVFDPHWVERLNLQARVLADCLREGILPAGCRAVDYGCGDGKLADLVNDLAGNPVLDKYDEYMGISREGYVQKQDLEGKAYDLVVTCSVFEHLLGAQDVERIFSLLKPTGTFALHTMVCEEIPCDTDWFYYLPVHCTFYTNEAMGRLFRTYGFRGCAYQVEARLWLFFRDLERWHRLRDVSGSLPGTWEMAEGFVDYWKQKPYREQPNS